LCILLIFTKDVYILVRVAGFEPALKGF
jgi:hypothetical protein